jgi:hypothetical protein
MLGARSTDQGLRRSSSGIETGRWRIAVLCCCASLAIARIGSARIRDEQPIREPVDAAALVKQVIRNEIDAQLHDNSLWCFREQKDEDGKPAKTLEVCGSQDGDLERVVAVDGRELSPAEVQAEDERIKKLLANPAQLRAKQKKQKEDAEQFRKLLKDVPEAFQFEPENSDGNLLNLHFRPNPAFRPSTRAETVFHHLEGSLAVDRRQMRIAEMDGRLTSEVKFFGGLLGHLDKGGTFHVKAAEVAPGHWDTTLLNLQLSGKALFFKTISVQQKEEYSRYTRIPPTSTLEQVAAQLKQECAGLPSAKSR